MAKSIIPGNDPYVCFLCGRKGGNTHLHHMIHGTWGRPIADRYGLVVHLCPRCHRRLHDRGEHDAELKQLAQKTYEAIRAKELKELATQEYKKAVAEAEQDAHNDWMLKVGKNYLED